MREALAIAAGEGLEAMWARHQQVQLLAFCLPQPLHALIQEVPTSMCSSHFDQL